MVKKFRLLMLSVISVIPLPEIALAAKAEIIKKSHLDRVGLSTFKVRDFQMHVLGGRPSQLHIEGAYDKMLKMFPEETIESIDTKFDSYLETLIKDNKIRIDSNGFISGSESGITIAD